VKNKKCEISATINSRKDFPKLIRSLGLDGIGIEIGVGRGEFSEVLLTSPLSKLYLLDCWWPRSLNDAKFNILKNSRYDFEFADNELFLGEVLRRFWDTDRVIIVRGFSEKVATDFADNTFDFVYIDANHLYDAVKNDLDIWWPKVKLGGVMAGHDYYVDGYIPKEHYNMTSEVKRAVDEFSSREGLNLETTKEMWPSWWVIKPLV